MKSVIAFIFSIYFELTFYIFMLHFSFSTSFSLVRSFEMLPWQLTFLWLSQNHNYLTGHHIFHDCHKILVKLTITTLFLKLVNMLALSELCFG